ncbi:MAG: carbohydrate kinase family protein [Anaerolineae bacterium]|nr:carbohydrate kinase family protein [Anaerolineae bacterium]
MIPDLSGTAIGQFQQIFQPGRLIEIGPATFSTGGAVSNTGLALNKLGIKTRLMGKIGDDAFGQAVKQVISLFGTDLADGLVVDSASSTSYTFIISPPGVDRMFLHSPGANDSFGADDVLYTALSGARLFHFGYPPLLKRMYQDNGAQLVQLFRQAKETEITTSLDMALPDPASAAGQVDWVSLLNDTLPYVDVFVPSIEEILYMVRPGVYDALRNRVQDGNILPLLTPRLLSDLGTQLLDMGAGIVALKLGDRGLYLRTTDANQLAVLGRAAPSNPVAWANAELWSPCFKADLVGTTGAGDATIAGFLSALLRGLSPQEAVTMAVAVGACNVEAADALGGLRTWDETLRRITDGWAKHPLCIDAPGWVFDDTNQLWFKMA